MPMTISAPEATAVHHAPPTVAPARRWRVSLALAASLAPLCAIGSDEPVDYGMVSLIRDEAYNNSKVMETLAQLTDVLGPRLTGSPAAKLQTSSPAAIMCASSSDLAW